MGRQVELEMAMRDFDYVLNSAKWLAADAREVQKSSPITAHPIVKL